MHILRHYPFSILVILVIWFLSFFTPPQTQLDEINNFDKIVHICMYGGLSSLLWIEYLIRHSHIQKSHLIVGSILLPILMSGSIEILQSCCTENRSGDWMDFAANCIGVLLASLAGYYVYRPLIRKKIPSGKITDSCIKINAGDFHSYRRLQNILLFLKIESYHLLLSKIFQVFLQSLTGEVNTTLHCTQRKVQLICDFAIFETRHIHGKRYTIFLGQRIHDTAHFL